MKIDRQKAADLIERFVQGNVHSWEWDDFISGPRKKILEGVLP